MTVPILTDHFSTLAPDYDAVLSDVWGVVHNGIAATPPACEALTRFREQGRERFLSSEELARLGDALREAETIGVPWVVDETSPKAKHVPKDNRRTKLSPYATAALSKWRNTVSSAFGFRVSPSQIHSSVGPSFCGSRALYALLRRRR